MENTFIFCAYFIYSEKARRTTVHTVKNKVKISQNFVAFSEYMNFKMQKQCDATINQTKLCDIFLFFATLLDMI